MNKIIKGMAGIVFLLYLIIDSFIGVKAEDMISANITTSKSEVSSGDIIDVTVALQNYNLVSVSDITTLKLVVDVDSDFFSYIENSEQDTAGISDKENTYMLYHRDGKVVLQFGDLTASLSRETTNLISFQVKVNEVLPEKSEFEIGFAEVKAGDRSLNIIPITASNAKIGIIGYNQDGNIANIPAEGDSQNKDVAGKNQSAVQNGSENKSIKDASQNSLNNQQETGEHASSASLNISDQNTDSKNTSGERDTRSEEQRNVPSNSENVNEKKVSSRKNVIVIGILFVILIMGIASKNKIKEYYDAWKKH